MGFPTVLGTAVGESPVGATAHDFVHDIPYPSGSGGIAIAIMAFGRYTSNSIVSMPGWTFLSNGYFGVVDGYAEVWYTTSPGTAGTTVTATTAESQDLTYTVYRIATSSGVPVSATWANNVGGQPADTDPPALTTGFGAVDTMFIAVAVFANNRTISTYPSGYSSGIVSYSSTSGGPHIASARKTATATGDDPGQFTFSGTTWQASVTLAIQGTATPVAAFSDVPSALSVDFTDESTGGVASWAWTFGDGGTSTLQNPSHVYAAAGNYSVTLTVTNGVGSDSITHDVAVTTSVPYDPPSPGLAILEIYVKDPGSPRWDFANWDEGSWGASDWVDVTPQGVNVSIQWGTTRPEQGVLAQPEAAVWSVSFFDPNRLLDPANADSPYYSDLKPGLPIRIRHRGVTVRTGQADVITHSMADDSGTIRGSDIISKMARADVPEDAILGDSLGERAQDAIAAAGLDVDVYLGGLLQGGGLIGPELGAQLDGARTVWQHILDAAQAVLYYPYVTRDARLGFRNFRVPANANRVIASPNLVDLNSIVDTAGLISEVHVQDTVAGGAGLISRAVTPTPWFGTRVFERLEETPDPDDWADTVLTDRSVTGIRWAPGEVYPLSADDVEYFAKIESGELVTLRMLEAAPDIESTVLILGGTITATPKKDDQVQWRFTFEGAASAAIPGIGAPERLTLDGGTATDYLTTESGSDYLYKDG